MTRRYSVLQKKLQELESQLSNLLSIPSHENSDPPDLTDLAHNLEFLKNLLSAEVASSPSKPHHLLHISRRLSAIESAIRDFEISEAVAAEDLGGSSCSCTDSCLNDDGKALYEQDVEDETALMELSGTPGENEAWVERSTVAEEVNGLVEWREHWNEERVADDKTRVFEKEGGGRRRFYGAMAIGVVFGMVFKSFIVALMGFQDIMENVNFVTPT